MTLTAPHTEPVVTVLSGCAPTPLAGYLKALAVLRLVAEQADPDAKAYWRDDEFVLSSRLDAPALEDFFLTRYRPTPLVAPWGGRSGFYPGSSENAAREALDKIAASDLERLAPFRETIAAVRALLVRLGMTEKVEGGDAKLELLRACRAELPDYLLPWLDACYVLTDEGRGFPPLLGTGGNEGSGSYVSGFAQQVIACIIERQHDSALSAALFGVARPGTGSKQTPGQFAPLAAGGPNATSGFEGGTVLNPWDFLLCLEGTLLFAAAATKRLESASTGALAYPFTVHAVGAGAGSVAMGDEPNARAETWFPLWDRPASLVELASVFSEGRVQVSGRTARDALDFARAVSSLGIQRGITSFQRYGYLQRFGRNVIAVPIDRAEVRSHPKGELINELDQWEWLTRFRRLGRRRDPEPPARLRTVVARLEDALFDLTRSDQPDPVQSVLVRLGEAQAYLARSVASREHVLPVPRLSGRWAREADDGSAEFRIAVALAGLHGVANLGEGPGRPTLAMGAHFAPIDPRNRWLEGAEHEVTWGPGPLRDNLGRLAERRLLTAAKTNLADGPWMPAVPAPRGAVGAWLEEEVDEDRLAELLQGLVLTRIPERLPRSAIGPGPLPPAYAILKPLFVPGDQLVRSGLLPPAGGNPERAARPDLTRDSAAVVRLLMAGRTGPAVALAIRRLRVSGLPVIDSLANAAHPDGKLLLSALLVPVSPADLRLTVSRVLLPDRERDQKLTTPDTEV